MSQLILWQRTSLAGIGHNFPQWSVDFKWNIPLNTSMEENLIVSTNPILPNLLSFISELNEPQIASLSSTHDTIIISWVDLADYVEYYEIKLTGQNVDTSSREVKLYGMPTGGVARNLISGETYSIVVTAVSGEVSAESLAVLKTTG